jgi:amidophosphoribosyltransferase
LEDLVAAIGLPKERLCTYCWDGKDVSCKGGCPGCPKKNSDGK